MMEWMIARTEDSARRAQARQIARVADRLRALFGEAAVSVADARVMVRGRGLIQRWLNDPGLRFLGRGYK